MLIRKIHSNHRFQTISQRKFCFEYRTGTLHFLSAQERPNMIEGRVIIFAVILLYSYKGWLLVF